MSTFVLIHGGSHGAWCWEHVIPLLRARGHAAFAFDLPGHGDDPTPRSSVTLESYVAAANRFVASRSEIVLVGHSLAGIILPAVAAANPSRISRVVFLAAIVLDAGERAIDIIPPGRRPSYFEMAAQSSDNTLWLPFAQARELFFSDLSEDEARRAYSRLTPQPFAPYLSPVATSCRSLRTATRYILCDRDQVFPSDLCLAMASKLSGELVTVDSGHDVMLSQPGRLAELLMASPS